MNLLTILDNSSLNIIPDKVRPVKLIILIANCFKSNSGIQFECSLLSFGLKLKNQKVDGISESIHTRTGNRRRFDIPKMKTYFGMGCLL